MTTFCISSVYHITFHGIYESFEGVILKHSSLALKWPSEILGFLSRLHVSLHNHCLSYRYQTRWAFYVAGKPLEREPHGACLSSLYVVFPVQLPHSLWFLLCMCYCLTHPRPHITVTFTLSLLITSVASVPFTGLRSSVLQDFPPGYLGACFSFFFFSFFFLGLLLAVRLRRKGLQCKKWYAKALRRRVRFGRNLLFSSD